MRRVIEEMSRNVYDVAIIGGGIYGASVARDAALRGLSVALIDKGDFGSGTSANSHKIIHGGLRYLQHGNVKRMRESIRERSILMKIAPHLVYPMPFLIPTYKRWSQGRLAMAVALTLNDVIGFDRNRSLQVEKIIPRGRLISKAECITLCPYFDHQELTGGALFYDGQVYNADRLTLSVLWSARNAGAVLVNYVQMTEFLQERNMIKGFRAIDMLEQKSFEVRARLVINSTGPWVSKVLNNQSTFIKPQSDKFLKAIVLVTRSLVKDMAVGIPGKLSYLDDDAVLKKGHRYFFITPWRNRSLIGTFQNFYEGDPDDIRVSEKNIQTLLDEINHGLQGAKLSNKDVYFAYVGLLPSADFADDNKSSAQLIKHYQIYDHAQEDGAEGLLSIIGVKYTTARDVAEKVIDLVLKRLGRKYIPSQTANKPIYGGDVGQIGEFVRLAIETKPSNIAAGIIEHLTRTYGSGYQDILRWGEENPDWLQPVCQNGFVIKAEVIQATRMEMAQKLSDVIFRRTDLGTAGFPGEQVLRTCAEIMAQELGWSTQQIQQELDEVRKTCVKRGILHWTNSDKVYASS